MVICLDSERKREANVQPTVKTVKVTKTRGRTILMQIMTFFFVIYSPPHLFRKVDTHHMYNFLSEPEKVQ